MNKDFSFIFSKQVCIPLNIHKSYTPFKNMNKNGVTVSNFIIDRIFRDTIVFRCLFGGGKNIAQP